MPLNLNPHVRVIIYLGRKYKLLPLVATAIVLSDFLPTIVASDHSSNAMAWNTHRVCAWTSVEVLVSTLTVLIAIRVSQALSRVC